MTLKDYKKIINDKLYNKEITKELIIELIRSIENSLVMVIERDFYIFDVLFPDYYLRLQFVYENYSIEHFPLKEMEGSNFYQLCMTTIRDQKLNQILNDTNTN